MIQAEAVKGSQSVIRRFTLRRIIPGAIIFGLFAAVESLVQGLGIVAAYPNLAQRTKLIDGLASNNVLGLFYGNKNAGIISGGGYIAYRVLPIIALIGAIWGLMFITKMLRGQEENGRWELLLAGQTSAPIATAKTIIGSIGGLILSFAVVALILIKTGRGDKLPLTFSSCLFYGLATIAGAAVAIGIGAVTSQLASTRRKAVMYGLITIILLFVVRSVGNVVNSLAWLKDLTPFGWIERMQPFYKSDAMWLIPLAVLAIVSYIIAIWLSSKRDMDESLIIDSGGAEPKFGLLNSQLGFDFRLTRGIMSVWLVASVIFTALIAGIDKTVVKSLASSGGFSKTFSKLSGNPNAHLEVAYLSAAGFFVLIILMIVVTNSMGAARDEEASSRLDNFVSGNIGRISWLANRLIVVIASVLIITVISNLIVWALAESQSITISFNSLLFGGLNILGPVVFLLGLGVLIFGLKPRLMSIVMYLAIGWSLTIDIVASAVKTGKFLTDTSLLHYIALVPAASPKWSQFCALTATGILLIVIGMTAFSRRDLEVE